MVPKRGLEPLHLAEQASETCVSTNSTTWAHYTNKKEEIRKNKDVVSIILCCSRHPREYEQSEYCTGIFWEDSCLRWNDDEACVTRFHLASQHVVTWLE